jgi:hypothetical protein
MPEPPAEPENVQTSFRKRRERMRRTDVPGQDGRNYCVKIEAGNAAKKTKWEAGWFAEKAWYSALPVHGWTAVLLRTLEVRVMHFFSFDRGIIVALCFLLWIGAAGLVCWMLVPTQLPDEPAMVTNPAAVVRAERVGIAVAPAQLSMAQRWTRGASLGNASGQVARFEE